jgi:hypothetical protein
MTGVNLRDFKKAPQEFDKAVEEAYDDVLKFVVKRAVLITPIETGALRRSIRYEVDGIIGDVIAGNDKVPYAGWVHEATYQLGPESAKQPVQPEGMVGNKYLTRAVDHNRKVIIDMFGEKTMELFKRYLYARYRREMG